MKLDCNRKSLLGAVATCMTVSPPDSPRTILQSCRMVATHGDVTMAATDGELGILHRVLGCRVQQEGAAVLPRDILAILSSCGDDDIAIVAEPGRTTIAGAASEFVVPSEDPELFPDVPGFDAESHVAIAAHDLIRIIKSTMFCCDKNDTRYGFGGVMMELEGDTLSGWATDQRRATWATAQVERQGDPRVDRPIVTPRVLKLLLKHLTASDPPVHLSFTDARVAIRTETAVMAGALLQGRFPSIMKAFRAEMPIAVPLELAAFQEAVEAAAVMASEETRAIWFRFQQDRLELVGKTHKGASRVQIPIRNERGPIAIRLDPRWVLQFLATLPPQADLSIHMADPQHFVVFHSGGNVRHSVSPIGEPQA